MQIVHFKNDILLNTNKQSIKEQTDKTKNRFFDDNHIS